MHCEPFAPAHWQAAWQDRLRRRTARGSLQPRDWAYRDGAIKNLGRRLHNHRPYDFLLQTGVDHLCELVAVEHKIPPFSVKGGCGLGGNNFVQ